MAPDLDESRVSSLADLLIEARNSRRFLAPPAAELVPATVAEAEAVDDRVAEVTRWPVLGWKIGCTSVHAQQMMGVAGPFAGRVYAIDDSGVSLGPDQLPPEPKLEGEFAFTVGTTIAPGTELDAAAACAAMTSVHAAIEVVGGRFADFLATPIHCVIADAGANSRLVLGPASPLPPPDALAVAEAAMSVDGATTGSGSGADVLGGPIDALLWLITNLSSRGISLDQGQVVTTGTATQVTPLPVGSTATATLAGLGSVTVSRHS